MASQQSAEHHSPVMGLGSKWIWQEDSKQLVLQKQSRRMSRRKSRPWITSTLPVVKKDISILTKGDRPITLEDVKAVAVGLISEDLIKKMNKSTSVMFDDCYRTDQMNTLLWSSLIYFNAHINHINASKKKNISLPGALGDGAREVLRKWRTKLGQSKANLGDSYSKFILGLEHRKSHHFKGGRSKISRTRTDQLFYETVYEFIMYTVWITMGYNHWKIIHDELGRIFRTRAFNRDFGMTEDDASYVDVEGLGTIYKDSEEYSSYRIYYDRPTLGSLSQIRSPTLVNILPSSKDRDAWVFEAPYRPPTHKKSEPNYIPRIESPPAKLGIIGEMMSNYEPDTLKYIEKSDDEESDSGSESEDDESHVSGIIEDYGDIDF